MLKMSKQSNISSNNQLSFNGESLKDACQLPSTNGCLEVSSNPLLGPVIKQQRDEPSPIEKNEQKICDYSNQKTSSTERVIIGANKRRRAFINESNQHTESKRSFQSSKFLSSYFSSFD